MTYRLLCIAGAPVRASHLVAWGNVQGMPREPTDATHLELQGARIPKLGLGTWELRGDDCRESVRDALALGYRHIDTAAAFGNERDVAAGLADAGIPRDDVWLTTKVWREMATASKVRRQAERSLKQLDVDRVDLLLLHWPSDPPLEETMGALHELREEGLATHVGVSNFPSALLRDALELGPLLANQVEFHPLLAQPQLLALAREREMALTASSPFAHGALFDEPALQEMALRTGRNAGQIALRWLFDQPNVSAIPKAASHENRAANLDVFGWDLEDEDRATLTALERGERTVDPSFAPEWD